MYNHQTTDLSIFRVFVGGLDAESGRPQPRRIDGEAGDLS